MAGGKRLSDKERGQIEAFKQANYSIRLATKFQPFFLPCNIPQNGGNLVANLISGKLAKSLTDPRLSSGTT